MKHSLLLRDICIAMILAFACAIGAIHIYQHSGSLWFVALVFAAGFFSAIALIGSFIYWLEDEE